MERGKTRTDAHVGNGCRSCGICWHDVGNLRLDRRKFVIATEEVSRSGTSALQAKLEEGEPPLKKQPSSLAKRVMVVILRDAFVLIASHIGSDLA